MYVPPNKQMPGLRARKAANRQAWLDKQNKERLDKVVQSVSA